MSKDGYTFVPIEGALLEAPHGNNTELAQFTQAVREKLEATRLTELEILRQKHRIELQHEHARAFMDGYNNAINVLRRMSLLRRVGWALGLVRG